MRIHAHSLDPLMSARLVVETLPRPTAGPLAARFAPENNDPKFPCRLEKAFWPKRSSVKSGWGTHAQLAKNACDERGII